MEKSIIRPTPAQAATTFSDIQFDMGAFINPAVVLNDGAGNVTAQFPPTYAMFLPAKLNRTPTVADQTTLANALNTIEASYPASPSGPADLLGDYGVPYFNRLPQSVVSANMPTANTGGPVLVEATPMPTDVVDGLVGGPNALIPGVTKERFNVNVAIENNDMFFHIQSDSMVNLAAIPLWFNGSNNLNGKGVPSPNFNGLFTFRTPRIKFIADRHAADDGRITASNSPRGSIPTRRWPWASSTSRSTRAGRRDRHVRRQLLGPHDQRRRPETTSTTAPSPTSRMSSRTSTSSTTPRPGPGLPLRRAVHRALPVHVPLQPARHDHRAARRGNTDQFTNGGGPAYINNVFQGTGCRAGAVAKDAAGIHRQQRVAQRDLHRRAPVRSRGGAAAGLPGSDGTPLHIRVDGPGFDTMDVPRVPDVPRFQHSCPAAGAADQFKLQFLVFVPDLGLLRPDAHRPGVAGSPGGVQRRPPATSGLERFITATRRQNFLVPPRRHRAFPLVELA